eukprot:SAG31_NODE_16636_length_701_cov_25.850498_2_plen_161_part_01
MLYVLVCCKYPFGFEGKARLGGLRAVDVLDNIRNARCEYPDTMAPALVQLLQGIFTVDPASRWTVAQIAACDWLKDVKLPWDDGAAIGAARAVLPEIEWPAETLLRSFSGQSMDDGLADGYFEDMTYDFIEVAEQIDLKSRSRVDSMAGSACFNDGDPAIN